ncbi:DUF885 domain-containing protein [Rivibacter subsaxonicus]|uniref:Uncharacterized protein (DUF885 family) n=1 Tax=Rivibacter subsaxonicus TaxID=457575 RepID=A0A4Q7W136_9BURK|nr:DUF885 domain-containing protein [Rivibacter subsaxonicus]RZU02962.1 uncharacterized protein (DUF885 family) [Rivibacter subsaxonicus]
MSRSRITVSLLSSALALGAAAGALAAKPSTSAPATSTMNTAAADSSPDGAFDAVGTRFIEALWRVDPEAAVAAGRYELASTLRIPDDAARARQLAFTEEWLQTFGRIDATRLSTRQRTDLGLLLNKLESDRWHIGSFREHQWNPAVYNVAGPIDLILATDYAPRPQRLRALLARIDAIPAYYRAARASLDRPTREHTKLAIEQAPGVLGVLADLGKAAEASTLSPAERKLFAQRLAAAKAAVQDYADYLVGLDQRLATEGSARSFRIGKALYEPKFGFDIQSGSSAEQTYRKALAAREQLLTRMDALADELWPKVMGDAPRPADRTQKIGLVIERLSARHVAREDFFKEIRRQIPELQDWVVRNDLLTMDPKKPLVVRETPLYQRGVAGAGIEAPGPYRPQDRTYYNVTPFDGLSAAQAESNLREYNHWILQILNIHEAIPGHYTQLVYANKSPSLVKSLFGNGAMVEGWAVYSERMMLESGYGEHAPEMWLMYSKWNLRSVTNTILDYSVHVLGMSEAEAMDLLTRQAFQTEEEARGKWRRVQLSSVQLTSYFSGYSEIMALREQRKQALGEKFRLKDFHEQLLGYGSAPVRVIRELMLQ